MEVSKDEVKNVASLARLGVGDDEIELFRAQLTDILTYFDTLKDLTASPQSLPIDDTIYPTLREDFRQESLARDRGLMNAPVSDGKYFEVPKIMD